MKSLTSNRIKTPFSQGAFCIKSLEAISIIQVKDDPVSPFLLNELFVSTLLRLPQLQNSETTNLD